MAMVPVVPLILCQFHCPPSATIYHQLTNAWDSCPWWLCVCCSTSSFQESPQTASRLLQTANNKNKWWPTVGYERWVAFFTERLRCTIYVCYFFRNVNRVNMFKQMEWLNKFCWWEIAKNCPKRSTLAVRYSQLITLVRLERFKDFTTRRILLCDLLPRLLSLSHTLSVW